MKFNINETVRIQLTEKGRELLKKNHEELYSTCPVEAFRKFEPPTEDEEGWSRWQLWCVMSTFGPHMHFGAIEQPFLMDIDIISPHYAESNPQHGDTQNGKKH